MEKKVPQSCHYDARSDLSCPSWIDVAPRNLQKPALGTLTGRVLVTGASGFVGSNMARTLSAAGHEVTCLVRSTSSHPLLSGVHAGTMLGDMTDAESLRRAVTGKSLVYHVAGCLRAVRPSDFYRVNEQGTRNLLQTCAEMPSPPVVVIVSSVTAAGPSLPDRPRIESDPPAPVSHYGRSKWAGELAAREFARAVPITIVRPPIVLGAADREGLAMFTSVARTGLHFVPGRVPHRFSVIHVDDLAEALALAAERGTRLDAAPPFKNATDGRGIYYVAGDEHPTYADLGLMIGEAVGRSRVRIVRIPLPVIWTVAYGIELGMRIRGKARYLNLDKAREIAAGSWTCSPEKARRELGFRPAASLSERLRQTAAWYRSEGWL